MEDLSKDPIISFYLKMSKSTEYETDLPVYSETQLRLAFTQVFGKLRPLCPDELNLYRKLLLFYYSEKHKSISDLMAIMTCFNQSEFNNVCFEQYNDIIEDWHAFTKEKLSSVLCKENFLEILHEWSRRYMQLFGELNSSLLRSKGIEIQRLFGWDLKYAKLWVRNFEKKILNPNFIKVNDQKDEISEDYLDIKRIYNDIKHKLNVVEETHVNKDLSIAEQEESSQAPAKKKARTQIESIEVLKVENIYDPNIQEFIKHEDATQREFAINDQQEFVSTIVLSNEEVIRESSEDVDDSILTEDDGVCDMVEIIDEDCSSEDEVKEHNDADEYVAEENELKIVDYNTALSYLSALQAFSVVNGHLTAIELLDKVDSIFRANLKK